MLRARIRGIYATALTYIFSKYFKIVQQSKEIASRFNSKIIEEPAEVTIKDSDEDKGQIIVICSEEVDNTLKEVFKYSFILKSPVKLYQYLEPKDCYHNGYRVEPCLQKGIVVGIPKNDKIILSEPRVVGKFLMIWKGEGKTFFSEYIKDFETKTKLLAISSPLNRKGFNVKWRSNAKFATLEEIKEEIEKLVNNLQKERFQDQGENFYIITLSLPDKLFLDDIRRKVIPTVKYHHMLKLSYGKELDEIEKVNSEKCPILFIEKLIKDEIEIEHVKINKKILLNKGKLINKNIRDCGYKLILYRKIISNGVYDGLEVPKEKGDYDIMEIDSNKWFEVHKYFSINNLIKGVYINISTPPELLLGKIRYLDLEVDVIVKDNGEILIKDYEEFERIRNYITDSLYNEIKRKLNEIIGILRTKIESKKLEDLSIDDLN
jgi:predicted transcriptional regulator